MSCCPPPDPEQWPPHSPHGLILALSVVVLVPLIALLLFVLPL